MVLQRCTGPPERTSQRRARYVRREELVPACGTTTAAVEYSMHQLRIYDYLTRARGRVFDAVRPLGAAAHAREFQIGLGSLGRTLTHLMICEWAYIERMQGRALPPYETWPIQDEMPPPFDVIESTWTKQAEHTRAAIEGVRDWSKTIEFRSAGDGPPLLVTASFADVITQMVVHEVHHRAQIVYMLRQLNATVPDLDFGAMTFDRRPAGQD